MTRNNYDVVIVGAGPVGLAMALTMAAKSLSVALIDKATISVSALADEFDIRSLALNKCSIKLLSQLNCWPVSPVERQSPYHAMRVFSVKGTEIAFDCMAVNEPWLGYIVENQHLMQTLVNAVCKQPAISLYPNADCQQLSVTAHDVQLQANDDQIKAKLIIAADGANSWVRDQLGIKAQVLDYQQQAMVAVVKTQHSHQQTAWQWFLKTGPLALLPLADENVCSLIWSADNAYIETLPINDVQQLATIISHKTNHQLGDVCLVSKTMRFPLKRKLADQYIGQRAVLIGDAAHRIHPLAGQGVNLGFADVVELSQLISDAIKNNNDFAGERYLLAYQRARKAQTLPMIKGIDYIKKLYAAENPIIADMRDFGLDALNRWQGLKNIFVKSAVG